ncbi:MAG: DNA polymerase III subunit gamma/tau [Armatimonadetes bacterium]|nr:DNA polymerase III subunit gamma/tau [Armatimonadota bacterium]
MSYQSFTLKYRPRTFDDIVGQEHISRTLKNAVAAGRIHHAYLFTGPRGTGKTTTARVLARALNCVNGPTPDPCGVCDACVSILEGRAMDVVEMDAASNNSVDDIRDLREKVKYSPAQYRCKLYILDEVHMLSTGAFNALLKTLEEPPAHAYFALLTTETHRVPATIISRCQRYDFRPISLPDQVQALQRIAEQEGIAVEDDALAAIARAAEGAMRDAESILEQAVAFSDGAVTLETVRRMLGATEGEALAEIAGIVARQDLAGAFAAVDRLVGEGKDLDRLVEDLTAFFRDLLRLALGTEGEAWLQLGAGSRQQMAELATSLGAERLLAALKTLAELRTQLKSSSHHSLLLEMALVELIRQPAAARPSVGPTGATATSARPSAPAVQPAAAAAPQPAPRTPVTPSPSQTVGSNLSLELIREHWDALGVQLRRMGQVPLAAFLKEALPAHFDEGRLTISFAPQFKFHFTKVSEDYRQTVEDALSRLFRRPITLICQLAEEQEQVTAAASQTEQRAPETAQEPAPASEPAPPAEPVPGAAMPPPQTEPAGPAAPDGEGAPPPEPSKRPLTAEEAMSQTLRLFPGAEEILPDPGEPDPE